MIMLGYFLKICNAPTDARYGKTPVFPTGKDRNFGTEYNERGKVWNIEIYME
jgi:hypothetical protein